MGRALVTGATSGIGLAITNLLLEQGYHVVGVGRSIEKLTIEHPSLTKLVCDISDESAVTKVIKPLTKEGDPFSVLINSAGFGYFAPHETIDVKTIYTMINTNLSAPIYLTNLLLRNLVETKGTVINITSIEATRSAKFSALYSATKAGLRAFSHALFEEVRRNDVKVISVNPDMTKTPFFDNLRFEPSDEASAIAVQELAQSVVQLLDKNSVVTDVTIRPQHVGIRKKHV
jgi:short-subunit dehydrogenase